MVCWCCETEGQLELSHGHFSGFISQLTSARRCKNGDKIYVQKFKKIIPEADEMVNEKMEMEWVNLKMEG